MPMEQGLKLVSPISTNGVDSKGKLLDHIVNEVNGVLLSMTFIDFQGPYPRGVVDGRVREPTDLTALGSLQ